MYEAISDEVTNRNNAITDAVSNLTSLINGRLKIVNHENIRATMGDTADDYEIANKIARTYGLPCFVTTNYAWAHNCVMSFYDNNNLVAKVDSGGYCGILVYGAPIASGSWNSINYLVMGGFNNSGSGANLLLKGCASFNGGSSVNRRCVVH